ncbi:unnamed protein product, partial [Caenorhabditis brenneri]
NCLKPVLNWAEPSLYSLCQACAVRARHVLTLAPIWCQACSSSCHACSEQPIDNFERFRYSTMTDLCSTCFVHYLRCAVYWYCNCHGNLLPPSYKPPSSTGYLKLTYPPYTLSPITRQTYVPLLTFFFGPFCHMREHLSFVSYATPVRRRQLSSPAQRVSPLYCVGSCTKTFYKRGDEPQRLQ